MARRVKRWRLSDVVHAMSRAAGDSPRKSAFLRYEAATYSSAHDVRRTLIGWYYTMPQLLRVSEDAWVSMTDEQREALVVAEARRLKVPRRA